MKYVYIILSIGLFVVIMIPFFQLLTALFIQVPFFTKRVDIHIFLIFMVTVAYLSGVCMTLGINGFMNNSDMGDDFDL